MPQACMPLRHPIPRPQTLKPWNLTSCPLTLCNQAMDSMLSGVDDKDLELACRAGICRTTLHMGDIRQGRTQALQLNSQNLFKECAHILEGLQQLTVCVVGRRGEGWQEAAPTVQRVSGRPALYAIWLFSSSARTC